ncbi:MAG: hypothetical protein A4E71_01143 [Smithella sp. PtaU1.Bin162]|nr:MAG: hypothetical protein A4E71_01143 [Smithella sp. PtaU1.Bin162]
MDNEVRFLSMVGTGGRLIAARLKPGTDLMGGITEVCRFHDIKQGYISCVLGSLRQAQYLLPILDTSTPSGIRYSDPITVGGPIEFTSGQGVICQSPEGELMIHFHGCFCASDGKSLAGHFSTGGNPVLVTADIIISEITGMRLMRRLDAEVGLLMMSPEKGDENGCCRK